MSYRSQVFLFAVSLVLCSSASIIHGQGMKSEGRNPAQMKFTTIPGLPTCTTGSVQSGNPMTGPSIILAKIPTGCSIPWHWHTPNENVMIVSGVGRMDMKDEKSLTLRAGGFAMMASHHVHQFKCLSSCQLYIYSDAAFDVHYVDKQGTEISPADAMKAVKQKAATEMK